MKTRLTIIIYAIVLLCFLAGTGAIAALPDQWPMFHRDSIRSGSDQVAPPVELGSTRPDAIWVFPRTPAVIDDDSTDVTKINIVNGGALTWTARTSVDVGYAPNAHNNNYHFVGTEFSATAQFETWTGCSTTWTFDLEDTTDTNTTSKFYDIYLWFPSAATAEAPLVHSTDTHVFVSLNGTVVGRFTIDQTTGNDWVKLNTEQLIANFGLAGDTVTVTMTNESQNSVTADHIVVADAVKLVPENGQVISSPVIGTGPNDDLVISSVLETRPLPTVTGQDASRNVGVIYGIHSEANGDTVKYTDARGQKAWSFPASSDNWIGGLLSSTPVVTTMGAEEVCVVAAGDGQVYVIRTADGTLVWQGPGYTVDDSDARVTYTGTWAAAAHSGFQGAGYAQAAATANTLPSADASRASAKWTPGITTAGKYSIYAWIPPSTSAESYIHDARYSVDYIGRVADLTVDNNFAGNSPNLLPDFGTSDVVNPDLWLDGPNTSPGQNGNFISHIATQTVSEEWENYAGATASWILDASGSPAAYSAYVYIPAVSGDDPGVRAADAHYIVELVKAANIRDVDNAPAGTSTAGFTSLPISSWTNSAPSSTGVNGNFISHPTTTGTANASATWKFTATQAASDYSIYVYIPGRTATEPNLRVQDAHYQVQFIDSADASQTVVSLGSFTIDQTKGGKWVKLGTGTFSADTGDRLMVKLTNDSVNGTGYSVIADAARFIRNESSATMGRFTIDQTAAANGNRWVRLGTQSFVASTGDKLIVKLNTETQGAPGTFVIADAAQFIKEPMVDQRDGGQWAFLGTYNLATSQVAQSLEVTLQNDTAERDSLGNVPSNLFVAADAIKVVPSDLGAFDLSSPTVTSDGTIYVGNITAQNQATGGRVYALSTASQDPTWVYPALGTNPVGAIYASPTLNSIDVSTANTLYVGSTDGHVYALNLADGSERWVYPLKSADPVDGKIYTLGQVTSTAALGNNLYVAVGGDSGTQGFTFNSDGSVGGTGGRIVALAATDDPALGRTREQWWYPFAPLQGAVTTPASAAGAFTYSSPMLMSVAANPTLTIGSLDSFLYSIDPTTGTARAGYVTPNLGQNIVSSPAGILVNYIGRDDVIPPVAPWESAFVGTGALGDDPGRIYGIRLSDGDPDWFYELFGAVPTSPAVFKQRIYAGDSAGFTWGFSTRGGGDNVWNSAAGEEPTTTTSEGQGRDSTFDYDVFTQAQYNLIMAAFQTPSPLDTLGVTNLHDLAIGKNTTDPHWSLTTNEDGTKNYIYEWGEQMYLIAWDLLSPNWDATTGTAVHPLPTDAGFIGVSTSTVNVSFNTKDTTTGVPTSVSGATMAQAGYYTASAADPVPHFYAVLAYQFGPTSVSPAQQVIVSAHEDPSTSVVSGGAQDKSSDVMLLPARDPGNTSIPYVVAGNTIPQPFTLNNPLALAVNNTSIGADAATGQTHWTYPNAGTNGVGTAVMPVLGPVTANHGETTAMLTFSVADRSLTGLISQTNQLKARSQSQSMVYQYNGNKATIPGWLEGEEEPGNSTTNTPNLSMDYPDISGSLVSAIALDSGADFHREGVDLPGQALGNVPALNWNVNWKQGAVKVAIPRFQPPNIEYSGSVYIYIDNGDGIFNPGLTLGAQTLLNQNATGRAVDPYRLFTYTATVNGDQRVDISDQWLDIGEVPQGFGLTPRFGNDDKLDLGGIPGVFHPYLRYDPTPNSTVSAALYPLSAVNKVAPSDVSSETGMWRYAPTYAPWFRTFNAYNLGNVNVTNLQVFQQPLTSDTVTDNYAIPLDMMKTTLDDSFKSDPWWKPIQPSGNWTFHKARVGEQPTQLTVVDSSPNWDIAYQFPGNRIPTDGQTLAPQLPSVSVAIPVGQPIGTYSGQFYLADSGVQISNPVNVRVTVSEAKVTDDYEKGHMPQLDPRVEPATPVSPPPAQPLNGNGGPAAMRDPVTGNLYMAFSSNRYPDPDQLALRTDKNPLGTDPWYLYFTSMPWAFPASDARYPYGTGLMIQDDTSATAANTSFSMWYQTSRTDMNKAFAYPKKADINPADPSSDARAYFPGTGVRDPINVIPNTIKFANPSFALDALYDTSGNITARRAWMFYSGEATKDLGDIGFEGSPLTAPGNVNKATESRGYYVELSAPSDDTWISLKDKTNPANLSLAHLTTADYTMPKLGFKGAAARTYDNSLWLWSLWYGGNNNRWRIFYNANPDPDADPDVTGWTSPAQLSISKDLVSAAEPGMIYRPTLGWDSTNTAKKRDVVEMVYSGFSSFRRNSDIYLNRFAVTGPQPAKDGSTYMGMNTEKLPLRSSLLMYETPSVAYGPWWSSVKPLGQTGTVFVDLNREASNLVWSAADADWDTTAGFRVIVFDGEDARLANPTAGLELTVGTPLEDAQTGAMAYTYDEKDTGGNYLYPNQRKYFRGVLVDPSSGSVKFINPPTRNARVLASFTPRAYRLTTESVPDVSPCAVLDNYPNQNYSASNFFIPTGWTDGMAGTRTDRLWLFWRRPSVDPKQGTGIHYKTFRHCITLRHQLIKPASGNTAVVNVWQVIDPVAGTTREISTPVEVDWVRNRLYFMSDEEGATVRVRYTGLDSNGATQIYDGSTDPNETYVVHLQEEIGPGASEEYRRLNPGQKVPSALLSSIGNVTRESVNEGQVCAFIDPTSAMTPQAANGVISPPKVWVFWSSTRSGTTDIYYEAISPKF